MDFYSCGLPEPGADLQLEEGVKAFDLYGRLLRLYGPPGSENNHWYEASSIMGQGKAAMYTEFDSISAFVEDPEKSKVKGKMGYAMFPKGPSGKPGTMATVWGLGIPKNSKNPKAGWLFLQWATSTGPGARHPERARRPGRPRLGLEGCQGQGQDESRAGRGPRPGLRVGNSNWNPPVVAVPEVRDAIGAAIVTSIQGGDVKAAVNKAAADTKRIMAETEKK